MARAVTASYNERLADYHNSGQLTICCSMNEQEVNGRNVPSSGQDRGLLQLELEEKSYQDLFMCLPVMAVRCLVACVTFVPQSHINILTRCLYPVLMHFTTEQDCPCIRVMSYICWTHADAVLMREARTLNRELLCVALT